MEEEFRSRNQMTTSHNTQQHFALREGTFFYWCVCVWGGGGGFDHCDLFSFLPFEGYLVMEKYKDSSSTLKDDSLSELYSPTQSMSLCSRFSRSIRSLSVSSFFFSLIYCFQRLTNFPLAFSFSHGTAAKAFLVGTSGPKGQVEF